MNFSFAFLIMWAVILIPLLVIVLIVIAVIRHGQRNNSNYRIENRGNAALEILDQRYAKGEISEEEYIHKKRMLNEP
ncbi:SHOCT domain-containing protein [Mobilitalea sibirica]|uniref:SHOCT domain-containing protein n=1 Tax=Mobilitalea sibirica TaxID=1462919 RepID=A0A8J7H4A0_9FIRM|nr:SHOCT domain-containing protein [Mobilitalea sibirica]MBH1942208.1 SHOCT domain-containing protein [Mobilitalea sibirica]